MTSVKNTLADGSVQDEFLYTYDAAGNLKTKTERTGGTERGTTAYTYDSLNRLSSVEYPDGRTVSYTYDGAGNRRTMTETVQTTAEDGTRKLVTVETAYTYNSRNQLVRTTGTEAGKKRSETVYTYDGNGNCLTETKTQYDSNGNGDVVALLSGGEVIATYAYDAFGNITGQTGEADNSVLYAGYQYDVETGLYYLNARMYDPVTARFLQADTYAGSQSDPLSLNLYTYCMNNPERYIDPSGHIAIELAVIVISAVVAGMAVEAGIQKFIEKKVCIDYNRIVGEGLFSGAISAISFGTGNLLKCTIGPLAAKNALSTGTGLTAKTLAAALIANAAGGAASEAAEEMAHQFFVEGRTFSQIDYRQIGISAALGTVVSAGSTLAGAGIDRLKAGRAAKKSVREVTGGGYKANLNYVTSNGLELRATPEKTTTVLGSYKSDTGAILNELGNIKSLDFGPRDGWFNLLNTPDELYISPNQFWNEYNKPWLDNAIARKDIIVIATEPTWDKLTVVNVITGKMELTGFGREYTYLKQHGYKYDSIKKIMNR